MKFGRSLGIILALACMQTAVAQTEPDSEWIFRDTVPDTLMFYFQIYMCDTNTFPNVGCFSLCDTGNEFDGPYINFNYQFTDTVENDTLGSEGPGYAAFKLYWDDGLVSYEATDYDSLCFWHKGPLPGHKVDLVWGQGGACGGPILYEYLGSFKSSTTWTKTVLPFPPGFVRSGIFQLNVLIHDDTGDTSLTSAKGFLKLANMCFVKYKGGPRTTPASPVLSVPTNDAKDQSIQPDLKWNTVDSANSYGVEVAQDSAFSSIVFTQTGLTQMSATVTDLLKDTTTYYWRTFAADAGLPSPWSATWSFETGLNQTSSTKHCGCGSGTGVALFPPIFFKIMASRRRRRQKRQAGQ